MSYTGQYDEPKSRTAAAAGNAAADLADKASNFANQASQTIDRTIHGAQDAVNSLADRGRDAGERVGEVASNLRGAVDKSVKDQPYATLAVVGALGFVLGALWKS